uniref:Uncharacterized protein n=1 Tax=Anguilla anguilla TaxID=7936 RepID=A0A0E9PH41_ANGAN
MTNYFVVPNLPVTLYGSQINA